MTEINKNVSLKKSLARLVIVQAIYAIDITGEQTDVNSLIDGNNTSENTITSIDRKFFRKIIANLPDKQSDIDEIITKYLTGCWTFDKLGALLRSILRAATYEIIYEEKTPSKVIISEYTDVASSFFDEKEIGFVNAILDKISNDVR